MGTRSVPSPCQYAPTCCSVLPAPRPHSATVLASSSGRPAKASASSPVVTPSLSAIFARTLATVSSGETLTVTVTPPGGARA